MDPRETIASTAEPAFATDPDGRIIAWNSGAERLLGHKASQVLGKQCFEVLQGTDVFGNRFCQEHCAIRSMLGRHEPVHQCRLHLRTASANWRETSMSVFVLTGRPPPAYAVMHVLEAVTDPPASDDTIPSSAAPQEVEHAGQALTARETEILRMMASGLDTAEISRRLSIADATVRNHIHHILNKMNVHSRLEAVCLAIRRRLL